MATTLSPIELVSKRLDSIHTAVDALFNHTNKAVDIRNRADRTTVMGYGIGPDAMPAKGETAALVQKMPGMEDDQYNNADEAKEARGKITKSVGGFVKAAVKRSAGKIADALQDSTFAPLGSLHSNNLKSIEHIKKALDALQQGINEMAGAMTGATRRASILRFDEQIRKVIGEYEKVNKLNEVLKGLDAQASAFTNVDGAENIEYDELENVQTKRDNIDKEILRATSAIVLALNTQAVVTPGSSSKDERYARLKPMSIPSPLEGKGADLQDMMLAYVLGKGTSMTTLIPAIQRMVQDFCPNSGLWWSWNDLSDKDDDYSSVPPCFRALLKDQSRQLYADIKTAMSKSTAHKAMWTHINAVHSLGRVAKPYSVTEGDGLGLFWMMTMLYRPSDETYRENLEQETYAMCRKLGQQSKGNPMKFIELIRQMLLNANALGVRLKWLLTGKMLVTNMASRNNILAQKLQGYLDGTTAFDSDDCAADIAHICALVEEGLNALEATGGDANRAFNTTSDSQGKTPCQFEGDCFALNCKYWHDDDHDKEAAWQRELVKRAANSGGKGKSGKGKGKTGKSGGKSGKQRCKQQGCQEHQKQVYCNAHYRALQEKNTASSTRKEKRAAKAELKSDASAKARKAAKADKAEKLESLLHQAKESGKQSERKKKRSRAQSAFIHSDDDDEDIRDEAAAPKSVKAARRLNKQANAKSIADLIGSDDDSSE